MKKYIITGAILAVIICILFYNFNKPVRAKESNKCNDIYKCENIVFFGDSITEWYPISEIFGDLPIVKSGIEGYETSDLLERMEKMVYNYNPTKVIILIGTNDLKYSDDDEQKVANNIQEIIKNIKEKRPKSKIYYQTIYPVNRKMGSATEERYNDEIDKVNEIMKDYCKNNNVKYIDMNSELSDDEGNFDSKYTNDGLHPNDLGYARISQVLLKYIYNLK